MWWRALAFGLCLSSAALTPAQQPERQYSIEKVMGNFGYASAVGWFKDHLLIADLPGGKITKIGTDGPSLFRDDVHASAIASDSENRVYLCDARQHRVLRIDHKNKMEVLASEYEGKPLLGPSGIAVGRNNNVWFTDSAWASEDQNKPRAYYGVFHISAKGELSLVARMTGRPNGIALSPDNKTLYVVDSDSRTVISWGIDRSGATSGERVLLHTKEGVPNGIVAGPDGTLYVAAGKIEVFSPAGEPLSNIELSEKPADLTFGDAQLANLYVAAKTSVYRVRLGVPPGAPKGGGGN